MSKFYKTTFEIHSVCVRPQKILEKSFAKNIISMKKLALILLLYFYNLTMHLHISFARFVNLNTSNNIGDTKGCCNAQSFDLTKGF